MSVEIQQFALFLILCKIEVTTQLSRVVIGESHAVSIHREMITLYTATHRYC